MSGIVGSVARTGGAGLAGVVGAQAVGGAVVGAAGGALFGLSYGTAIRVGYEQIYPALFPDGEVAPDLDNILHKLETMYDFIGGKAAHIFGVEQGVRERTVQGVNNQDFVYGDIRPQQSSGFLETLDGFFKAITPIPSALNILPAAFAHEAPVTTGSYRYIDSMSLSQLSIENAKIRNGTSSRSQKEQNYIQSTYSLMLQKKRQTGNIIPSTPTPTFQTPVKIRQPTGQEVQLTQFMNRTFAITKEFLLLKRKLDNNVRSKAGAFRVRLGTQWQKQHDLLQKQIRDKKLEYYRFLSVNRNSRNPSIKIRAGQMYKRRELK